MTGYNAAMDALITGLQMAQERTTGSEGQALAALGPPSADNALMHPVISGLGEGVVDALRGLSYLVETLQPLLIQVDASSALLQTAGDAIDGLGEGVTATLDSLFAALGAEGARTSIRRINDAVGLFGDGLQDLGDVLESFGDPGRFITTAHLCHQLAGSENEPEGSLSDIISALTP